MPYARSQGAVYVRRLPVKRYSISYKPNVPTLLWTDSVSLFFDTKGNCRPVWGLDEREAREICTLKGCAFKHGYGDVEFLPAGRDAC